MNDERRLHVMNSVKAMLTSANLDDHTNMILAWAISEGIEVAMAWNPEPPATIRYNQLECQHQWDEFMDASTNPSVITRLTCLRHGVRVSVGPHLCSSSPRAWQRDEALRLLDNEHGKP